MTEQPMHTNERPDPRPCPICGHPVGHHGPYSCAGDDTTDCDCAKRYALAATGELRPPYAVHTDSRHVGECGCPILTPCPLPIGHDDGIHEPTG